MATKKYKVPEGWSKPKEAQTIVNHVNGWGGTLELDIKEVEVPATRSAKEDEKRYAPKVVEAHLTLPDTPATPDPKDESAEAKAARETLAIISNLERVMEMYTFEEVT